jgi:membrane protein
MRFWIRILLRSIGKFYNDNGTNLAAAVSYYVLLSLFPFLIFILSLLGMFFHNSPLRGQIVETIVELIPSSGPLNENSLVTALRRVEEISGVTGFIGLLVMAWSGSGMFGVIRTAINRAFNIKGGRNVFLQKLLDFAMIAAATFFMILSVSATALVKSLQQISMSYPAISEYPLAGKVLGEAGIFWSIATPAIPFVLSFLACFFLYWIAPATRVPVKRLWPGAVIAAVLLEAAKLGFAWFLTHFARYDVIFGSLGAVVAFLVWVYLSAIVLILGAEISSEYARAFETAKVTTAAGM